MLQKHLHITSLICDLIRPNREGTLEGFLEEKVFSDSLPAEIRLKQAEQILDAYQSFGLLGTENVQDIQILLRLGNVYERFLHYEKALQVYQMALSMAERLEDLEHRATVLFGLGRVLFRLRQWDDALDFLGRSLVFFRETKDVPNLALGLLFRGLVFHEMNDLKKAEEAYREAIVLATQAGDQKLVCDLNNLLAVLATIKGNLEDAVKLYRECLVAYQDAENDLELARTYHNLGMAYADLEDGTAAMACYEQASERATALKQFEVMANVSLSQAELLLDLGETPMATSCCGRALDIYLEIKDRLGEADTYRLMGRGFALQQQWVIARAMFLKCIQLSEEYNNILNAAEAYRDLGKMHVTQGDGQAARNALDQAIEGFRKLGAQKDVRVVSDLIAELNIA